jgi:hypothetical protein
MSLQNENVRFVQSRNVRFPYADFGPTLAAEHLAKTGAHFFAPALQTWRAPLPPHMEAVRALVSVAQERASRSRFS